MAYPSGSGGASLRAKAGLFPWASRPWALGQHTSPLQKFLNAAQFWKARDSVISYFCRLQALELGISQFGKDPTAKPYLVYLLQGVEQEKRELAGHEALTDPFVGQTQVLNVANKLFELADSQDRAGAADATTARLFANFIVLCDVFKGLKGEDSQLEERHQYARFKATDIAKCIREGRTPQPGAPGESAPPAAAAASDTDFLPDPPGAAGPAAAAWAPPSSSLPAAPPAFPPSLSPYPPSAAAYPYPAAAPAPSPLLGPGHSAPPSAVHLPPPASSLAPGGFLPPQPPASAGPFGAPGPARPASSSSLPPAHIPHTPTPSPAPASAPHAPPSSSSLAAPAARPMSVGGSASASAGGGHHNMDSLKMQDQASKHCKFAISALQYSDVPTAIANLEAALRCLRP